MQPDCDIEYRVFATEVGRWRPLLREHVSNLVHLTHEWVIRKLNDDCPNLQTRQTLFALIATQFRCVYESSLVRAEMLINQARNSCRAVDTCQPCQVAYQNKAVLRRVRPCA